MGDRNEKLETALRRFAYKALAILRRDNELDVGHDQFVHAINDLLAVNGGTYRETENMRDQFAQLEEERDARHTDKQVAACIEALKILDPKTVRVLLVRAQRLWHETETVGDIVLDTEMVKIADQLLKEFVSE